MKTLPHARLALLSAAILLPPLSAGAVTFTNNTAITFDNSNYDGADIVVTNCTLIVDGAHTFASLHILNGGTVTHSFSPTGVLLDLFPVSGELHVLTGTNSESLNYSNAVVSSILVTDGTGQIIYAPITDYVAGVDSSGAVSIRRTAVSAIPDGGTVLVNYFVLHPLGPTALNLSIDGNVLVSPGGSINADGQGYGAGYGPGYGDKAGNPWSGSGAGHGGYGGISSSNALGGNVYDSIFQPVDKGSAGGNGIGGAGGIGGGAIKLVIGSALQLDGSISANGADATNSRSGGGSGGSIWISAGTVAGTGSISANGGMGEPIHGGGGGGGRAAVYFGTNAFTGSYSAHGGTGFVTGGAGTVYTKTNLAGVSVGQVLLDNNGRYGTNTPLQLTNVSDLTVRGGAVAGVGLAVTVGNLLVESNGWIVSPPVAANSLPNLTITATGNADIQQGGGILADGKGYPASQGSQGPGGGQIFRSQPFFVGSGGGYGGFGSSGNPEPAGGNSYGRMTSPTDPGSSGGLGGAGGGVIRLNIRNALAVDGRISANGNPGTALNSGGGSGGSIWIAALTLTGSGSISADGGDGNGLGGGGGGGRIALSYRSGQIVEPSGPFTPFAGAVTAYGGKGAVKTGGAGTIYFTRDTGFGILPSVLVDNNGNRGANTTLGSPLPNGSVVTVSGGASLLGLSGSIGNLLIGSNAFLLVPTTNRLFLAAGNVTVEHGGAIIADGSGYSAGSGPGAGRAAITAGAGGGGGGYGGLGGNGFGGTLGGNAYGFLTTPSDQGSGGGSGIPSQSNLGGAGGGALQFNITGILQVDGSITANAFAGSGTNSGGGSGGSLLIFVGTLSGYGTISANGGAGTALGGGGGGGRIAVLYNTNLFTGQISAYGGAGFVRGGAGTIYLVSNRQQSVSLIMDNGRFSGAGSSLGTGLPPASAYPDPDLTISGGALFVSQSASLPALRSLLIASNSWLVATNIPGLSIFVSSNAVIESGGGIMVSREGITSGSGDGLFSGGGGAYAGYGSPNSTIGIGGGQAFGNPFAPVSPGGNGAPVGPSQGGGGGPALRLTVNGSLMINGSISSDGQNGISANSGGGAGGGIWLTAGQFSGHGTISANGGRGNGGGGSGGGGRVSMICTVTNSFTGTITARGGGGTNFGGAGTIYINGYPATTAQLVSDNGGNAGAYTLIAQSPFIFPNPRPSTIDLTVSGAASAIPSSSLSLRNLFIASNSWLIASELSVSSNITVQSGGGISADSAGLHGGQGAGHVISSALYPPTGSGGGYAGHGGTSLFGALGGNSYGDFQGQFSPGSGGGATVPNAGGAGGGSLSVIASTLQLDGKISADGGHATNSTSGGGSGGAVQLIVTKLSGSGIISASGGSGGALGGGGGGGGRIALNVDTNLFTGSLRAWGGDGGGEPGGAGTVYINNRINQHIGKLILDNGDLFGADTPLSNPGRVDLSVKAGAIGSIDGFAATPLNNLTIGADGLLTTGASATNLGLVIASNAVIESSGALSVDGKGFPQGNGPGAGHSVGGFGSGAGYGAAGGDSPTAPGGLPYGSAQFPIDLGSGGGAGSGPYFGGSQGGGAVHIAVLGTLSLNGLLSASGNPGFQDNSGGGSGGSIWVSASKMEGSGFLTADGGDGDPYYGGGGSGGRIAVYANSNSFAGTIIAIGGDGFVTGAVGSTLLSTNPAFEIAALAPSGIVTNPVNSLIVTFSSPVSADSFVPSSDVTLVTPSGPLPQDQFSAVALSPASFRVLIPSQTLPGDYAVTVGPNVTDIFGRVMSQVYTGAFTIDLPVIRGKVTDTNAIPVPGVLLQTSFAQTVTDTNGDYVIGFPAGANFSVTPLKTNLVFAPGSLSYSNLTASVSNQNYLALTTIAPQLNATLQSTNLALNWYGYPGVTYQLYRSTNLADWTLYGHPMFGSNAVIEIPLPVNRQSMEFFRAQANN